MDQLLSYLPAVMQVLGALMAILIVIAPLTKSNWDNIALEWVRKLALLVAKLITPRAAVAKP